MLTSIRQSPLYSLRRRRSLVLVLAGVGVGVIAAVSALAWRGTHAQPAAEAGPAPAAETTDVPPAPTVLVFVSGAVVHPGLYHLTSSARIADALAAAGGITPDADPSRLPNESSRVHDGRQVNVPYLRSGPAGARSIAAKVDINTATVDELRSLPEMPPGVAEAIVEHRTRWGAFATVSELKDALGLDRATVASLARALKATRPP